jgi:hypothetical protein
MVCVLLLRGRAISYFAEKNFIVKPGAGFKQGRANDFWTHGFKGRQVITF